MPVNFGGRYITAEDVGTTLADLVMMREVTCHTAGATAAAQQALPATAFGVFEALRAAAEVCLGRCRPGGAASRRPRVRQCRYAIVRPLVGGGGGIGGQ